MGVGRNKSDEDHADAASNPQYSNEAEEKADAMDVDNEDDIILFRSISLQSEFVSHTQELL